MPATPDNLRYLRCGIHNVCDRNIDADPSLFLAHIVRCHDVDVLEEGRFLPKQAYFSEDWFDREMDQLFRTTWVLLGYYEELKRDGSLRGTIGSEPVIVVDTPQGPRGYLNVCPHRGMPLECNQSRATLKCSYHAWEFSRLDGGLRTLPQADRQFPDVDKATISLIPIEVHTTRGLIFGSIAPVVDFDEYAGGYEAFTCRAELSDLECVYSVDEVISCNWKLLAENHVDVLHLWYLHTGSLGMYDHGDFDSHHEGPHWVSAERLREDDHSKLDLDRRGLPMLTGVSGDEIYVQRANLFFPTLMETSSCTRMCTYNLVPLSPTTTRLEIRVRAVKGHKMTQYGVDRLRKVLIDEDAAAMEQLQMSVRSSAFVPKHFSARSEYAVRQFHQEVLDRVG